MHKKTNTKRVFAIKTSKFLRKTALYCFVRGRFAMRRGYMRLTEPMVRENGTLRVATWEEALSRAAEGFTRARKRGPQAFGVFSCSKASNEVNFAAQKFVRQVMGTNNIDSCNRT